MKREYANHRSCPFAATAGVLLTECLSLWCGFSLVLALLMLAEWRLLREWGVEYIPKDSVQQVNVRTFSVSADSRWAASIMSFWRGRYEPQAVDDLVVLDLKRQTARRLHLGDMTPCRGVISPTADALAIACHDGSVHVATGVAGRFGSVPYPEIRCLLRGSDAAIQCLVFSPDGRFLAVARSREIHVLPVARDARSCPPQRSIDALYPCSSAVACGRCSASGEADEVGGRDIFCQAVCAGVCTSLAFTADSRQLVMLDCHGEVSWWDRCSSQQVATRTLTDHDAVRTTLSADGRFAAVVCADGTMHCWDLPGKRKLWRCDTALLELPFHTAFEFSPEGRLLVTACWTNGNYVVRCYDTGTGGCSASWPPCQTAFKGLAVASAGLVYSWDSHGVIRAWNVARGCEQWRFSWVCETDR